MSPTEWPTSHPTTQPSNFYHLTKQILSQGNAIVVATSSVAVAFGVLGMYVIVESRITSRKKSSGFQLLLLAVTVLQTFFDVTYTQNNVNVDFSIGSAAVYQSVYLFSLVGVAYLTNIMSLSTAYILHYKRPLDVRPYFYLILFSCYLLSQIPLLVVNSRFVEMNGPAGNPASLTYNVATFWVLFVSFILNIGATCVIIAHVRKLNAFLQNSSSAPSSGNSTAPPPSSPYTEIARRVACYPIIQLITRFAFMIALYDQGGESGNVYSAEFTQNLFLWHMTLTPLSSVGYTLCLLYFQPGAATSALKPWYFVAGLFNTYICVPCRKQENQVKDQEEEAKAEEDAKNKATPLALLEDTSSAHISSRSVYSLLSDDDLLLECTSARSSFLAMDEDASRATGVVMSSL